MAGFVIDSESGKESLTARKPDYASLGAPLARKEVAEKVRADKKAVWKLMATDFENDYELEDEDELLNDGLESKIDKPPAEDCNTTTKKRACKNCSCGLKELIEAEEKGVETTGKLY